MIKSKLFRKSLLFFVVIFISACSPFGKLSFVDLIEAKLKFRDLIKETLPITVAIIRDPSNSDSFNLYVSKNWEPEVLIKSITADVFAVGNEKNNDIFSSSDPDYIYFFALKNTSSPSDTPAAALWKTDGTSDGTKKYIDLPGETTQILSVAEHEKTILINGLFSFSNILGNSKDDVLVYTKSNGDIQYYSDYLGLTGDGSYYYSSRDLSVGYTSLGVRLIGIFKFTSAGSKINSTLEKLYLFKDGVSTEVSISPAHLQQIKNAYYGYYLKSIGFSGNFVLFQNFTSTSSNSFPDYINIGSIDMTSSSPALTTLKVVPYDMYKSILSEKTIDFTLYNAATEDLWQRYDTNLNQINNLEIDNSYNFVGKYNNYTYFVITTVESGLYSYHLKKCDSTYVNCVLLISDANPNTFYLSNEQGRIYYTDNNGVNKVLSLETLNIENNTKLSEYLSSKSLYMQMQIVKIIGDRIFISDRIYRSIVLDQDYKEVDDFYLPCSAGNTYDEQINSANKLYRFNSFDAKKLRIGNVERNYSCE